MRLVHQHHHALALGSLFFKQVLQGLHDDIDALPFQVEAKAIRNGIQHFFARQAGVGQINRFHLRRQTL